MIEPEAGRILFHGGMVYHVTTAPLECRDGVHPFMHALVFESECQVWSVPLYKQIGVDELSEDELFELLDQGMHWK